MFCDFILYSFATFSLFSGEGEQERCQEEAAKDKDDEGQGHVEYKVIHGSKVTRRSNVIKLSGHIILM